MDIDEICNKYGEVKLKFSEYYKYSFGFSGTGPNGEEVYASVGGDSDDIYKFEVEADTTKTINSLSPNYISITKGKETIADWTDF